MQGAGAGHQDFMASNEPLHLRAVTNGAEAEFWKPGIQFEMNNHRKNELGN